MARGKVIARGLVEHEARRQIAQTLLRTGPRTARGLTNDTGLSMASSRYHLRVLASAGVVTPFLKGAAKVDEVAYVLRPERLPSVALVTPWLESPIGQTMGLREDDVE